VFQKKLGLYTQTLLKLANSKRTKKFSYKPKSLNVADCFNSKVKLTS